MCIRDSPAAPLLLENKEKGGYQVDLRPEIGLANLSFNVTHPDLGKREVYADLRFRKAMSVAINREEINEVAFFGLGQPKQFIGFTPRPDFVDEKWESYMIQYDPDMANSLLDEIGMVDKDGDGYRELPNGEKIVINMQFATQGVAGQVVEMVGQNWDEVGVKTTVKEVTPDEYRSAQSANQLDIGFIESFKISRIYTQTFASKDICRAQQFCCCFVFYDLFDFISRKFRCCFICLCIE